MNVEERADLGAARIAAAIGEPARARMLYALMDGHARTATELAVIAEVGPPTASMHLRRLVADELVSVAAAGRHRYFRLAGEPVARVLEGLNVLAGRAPAAFEPATPDRLRIARSCYDHLAGTIAVALCDRLIAMSWLRAVARDRGFTVTSAGEPRFADLGIDLHRLLQQRRRFAFPCMDWSERRPHIGGALGAALLETLERKRWFERDDDSRALAITARGARELRARFGVG
jgi:DNA-binding transcriptional ArsR family regulator